VSGAPIGSEPIGVSPRYLAVRN